MLRQTSHGQNWPVPRLARIPLLQYGGAEVDVKGIFYEHKLGIGATFLVALAQGCPDSVRSGQMLDKFVFSKGHSFKHKCIQ